MPKGLTFLLSLALSAFLTLPAYAESSPSPDAVVARVNGEEITLGHVIVAYMALPDQYKQIPAGQLYTAILDQLIQQNALIQSRSGEISRRIVLSLENERRSLLAGDVVETIMQGAASDADIEAAYARQYAEGFGGDEFNASHILVETEVEAAAIKAELDGGADFATLAKEKSTGPSGPNGGALGWFGLGAMVPEFEAAVVKMKTGEISAPVKTQFGWHVITLNEKRKVAAPKLADVREDIANQLRQEAVTSRIDELVAAATVERPEVEGLTPESMLDLDLIAN
jgi:peptidyl-prolyl cis-trans isomerase C